MNKFKLYMLGLGLASMGLASCTAGFLEVQTCLTDSLHIYQLGKIVSKRDITDTKIIAILYIQIRELPVDISISHTRNSV